MIPVLTKQQARMLDEKTIQTGTSESELMHNAGRGIARFFLEEIIDPFSQKVLVVAGSGNNGGDAIIAHHFLLEYGINSTLYLIEKSQLDSELLDTYTINKDEILIFEEDNRIPETDWVIEGIFGIGLKREVSGIFVDLIHQINQNENVISVDLPSGIYCDTGKTAGISIHADLTLTIGYPKIGHLLIDGVNSTGELHILDIGFTELQLETRTTQLLTIDDIAELIHPYPEDAHKYSKGKVGMYAGSIGMTGAGILSANSTLKVGAGISRMVVPKSLNSIFEENLIEVITEPLDDNNLGYLSIDNLDNLEKISKWCDCFVCGPGLSPKQESIKLIQSILKKYKKPLILDGAGFTPITNGLISIFELSQNTILTPHHAEFAAMFNISIDEVKDNPIGSVKGIISDLNGRVLILKGAPTIICNSFGKIEICNFGTPILATAGTGDVLSGILGGLVAQGYSIDDAARIGVFLHSTAGLIYADTISERGMFASDLLEFIPIAWQVLLDEI